MHTAAAIKGHDTHFYTYIILVLSVCAFGFTAVFAHMADAPGIVVATWRVGVAAGVLTAPFLRQPPQHRRLDRVTLGWGLAGGVIFTISLTSFHLALDYTTAANATFLGNVAPLWVGLITLFVLHKALPHLFWPGVAVALAGAGLIVFGGGGLKGVSSGDLLVLANSTVWATYQVLTGRAREQISTLTWVWLIVSISAFLMVPFSLLVGYHLTGYNVPTILAMIGSGVVSQVSGFIGYNYALGLIPASRVSVVNMLQPVVTAVAAFLLLAEPFTGWRLVGGGLVLAGVYLVNRPERRVSTGPELECT